MPAAINRISIAAKALPTCEKTIPSRLATSTPVSIGHASGFSMKVARNALISTALSLAKKTVKIRIATKEARIGASFECGNWPFSTASRIFFSVASSVLLSLSADSAMRHPLDCVEGKVRRLLASAWTAVRTPPRRQA